MTPYLLLPLLALGVNLGLTLYALLGPWRPPGHRVLVLFLLGMALWGATLSLMRSSPDLERAFFWDKWVVMTIATTGVLYLHFSYRFSGLIPARWVLPGAYSMLGVAAALTAGEYIVTGMQRRYYGYAPVLGPAFYPFIVFVYGVVFAGFLNALRTARTAYSVSLRNRAAYLLVGSICSIVGGTTDYLAAQGLPMYPLGIVGNVIFAILSTFSLLHERLLDLRRLVRGVLSYGAFAATVTAAYLLVVLAAQLLGLGGVTVSEVVPTLPIVFGVALVAPFLLWPVRSWAERGFSWQRYGALKSLEQFSQQVKDITDLHTLDTSLVSRIRSVTQAQYVALLQPQSTGGAFAIAAVEGAGLTVGVSEGNGSPFLERIGRESRVLMGDEVALFPEWEALAPEERAALQQADPRLWVPVKSKGQLTGLLLLGPKATGGSYSQEDLDLLGAVANQAATAMENARLFQELQQQLQKVAEAQAQVIQSAKLASVGLLAAGVAHEINNPVFAIQGRAELLLDQGKRHLNTDKAREYVSVIYEMSERIATVVRDLLTFSRREDGFAPLDLNATLDNALRLVEPELRHANIQLKREYAEGLPAVRGNRTQLQQVLLNLIFNARDAMPEGGSLTVRTTQYNGEVSLSCSDTGVGIPPQHVDRIFDPFFTTKEVGKGVGLGLYVCQRIVQDHGGRLEVQSAVGRGSTFTIALPVVGAPAKEAASERS